MNIHDPTFMQIPYYFKHIGSINYKNHKHTEADLPPPHKKKKNTKIKKQHCAYRKACKTFSAMNTYKYFDMEVSS